MGITGAGGKVVSQVGVLVSPELVFPQIHWPASQQRIEECILSGKNSNVSNPYEPPSASGVGLAPGTGGGFTSLYPTLEKPSSSMNSYIKMGWRSRVLQCPVIHSVPARQVLESFLASRRPSSLCCFFLPARAGPCGLPARGPCQPQIHSVPCHMPSNDLFRPMPPSTWPHHKP